MKLKLNLVEQETAVKRLRIHSDAGDCVLLYRKPDVLDVDADQWRNATALQTKDRGRAQAMIQAARRQVFSGWEGIEDPNGNPIAFSGDRLLQLILTVPEVEKAVMELTEKLFSLETLKGELLPPPAIGTADVAADVAPTKQPGHSTSSPSSDVSAVPASPTASE